MEDLETIAMKAVSIAMLNGVLMCTGQYIYRDYLSSLKYYLRSRDEGIVHCPFTLTPSPFPKAEFERAYALQETVHLLQHLAAFDKNFLKESLRETAIVDSSIEKLLSILNESNLNKPVLGIFRADYMLNEAGKIKQVEVNTIASSFASLSTKVTSLHKFVCTRFFKDINSQQIPENGALSGLVNSLAKSDCAVAVAMIILPNEKNLIDQNFIEYFLLVDHGIPMLRISLSDINSKAKLEDNFLFINDYEISVAYFRSGYNPEHYPTELEWNARRIIEKSQAISCPSVAYQLSGTKKVQQMLSSRETLSKFIKDESKKEALMEIFMTMYPANESAVKEALCNPSKFVMKPQREGGGNNFYDENLVKILKNATEEQKKEYILMEKINSKPRAGHVVRNGQLSSSRLVSELGIFGSIFVNEKGDVLYNKAFGHLLRSKCYSENDGGIAAGVAVLDSPLLK